MEVTSANFEEVLAELDEVLINATFLAIDGEFTGLNTGPDAGIYDRPAQYYSKLRAGSMDFLLVQFGLSVFTFNAETEKYNQRSYNFYVFPRPLSRAAPDSRFMCQSSSISFLANQGFDFNKLFKLGIPYLNTSEETTMMKRLEERRKTRDEPEILPISEADKPQIEDICRRINEFINSEVEELMIDKCNAFIRRLVYQEVKQRWPNKLKVENKLDKFGCVLVVQRVGSEKEERQKEAEKLEKELMEVEQALGLTAVIRKIAYSGKLIVGHNMLLDLCHIFHQFLDHLPEKYEDFKCLVHECFPRILDTKLICHSQQFKESVPSSNLGLLLETVSKSPFKVPEVEPIDGRSYSTLTEKCHEAGYDAYITGICFIALSNYLGSLQNPEIPIVLPDSPLLEPFLNKLVIGILKDVPYINLDGQDPDPSRDHVFHLTFPKEWKFTDISHLFSPFGSVHVSWLSDTSAYVALNRREQATSVMKILNKPGKHYKMQTYHEYQLALLSKKHFAGSNHTTEEKLPSSESIAAKKGDYSVATNGVKTTQNDDGWEVATGNDHELSSEPIIPSPYPHERSRATSRPRGTNHEAGETLPDRSNVAQKISVKNSHNLPTDSRNGPKKDAVPKDGVLKRNVATDHGSRADDEAGRSAKFMENSFSKGVKHERDNSLISDSCKFKRERNSKKQNSSKSMVESLPIETGSREKSAEERLHSMRRIYRRWFHVLGEFFRRIYAFWLAFCLIGLFILAFGFCFLKLIDYISCAIASILDYLFLNLFNLPLPEIQ